MGFPPLRMPPLGPAAIRGAAAALIAAWLAGCGGETVQLPPSGGPAAPPPTVATQPPTPTTPPPGSLELGQPGPGLAVPGAPAGPPSVALLLPLTGRASGVGLAMRNAAEMALFEIADDSFVLSVHDTASTPAGAAAAAEKAIAGGARMIVGPLFATEVTAVAPLARPAGVPVVAFSNDRSVAGAGVWVFGLLPSQQVERVVQYSAARGLGRFGALVPANPFGSAALQALHAAAGRAGASVVATESYPTGRGNENGPLVDRFARRVGAGGGSPYIDAVLVPDGGAEIRNLAPLMAYYDIDNAKIRYLGSALWNDPELTREPALSGGWFAAPSPDARQPFEQRYRSMFGSAPPGLASLAYDAVSLAAVMARQPGGPAYDAESLTQPSGFAGVDGLFRLMPDGSNQRGLAVLRLTPQGIQIEDPAPTSFEPLLN